jgi:hypothetical protein
MFPLFSSAQREHSSARRIPITKSATGLYSSCCRKLFTHHFQSGLRELPRRRDRQCSDAEKGIRLSTRERDELPADQLASFDLIHIAPHPSFTRFIRPDKRVFAAMKMFGGVLVLR